MRRLLALMVVLLGASWAGAGQGGFQEPAPGGGEEAAMPAGPPPSRDVAGRDPVDELLARVRSRLNAVPGVIGIGHALTDDGRDAVDVTVTDESVAALIPRELEGLPVIVRIVPGGFRAYDA